MPSIGTLSHITLLVATYLSGVERDAPGGSTGEKTVAAFLVEARIEYGSNWNKGAREPGAETELAHLALARLAALRLVIHADGAVRALPALMRFSVGDTQLIARRSRSSAVTGGEQSALFP